MELDDKVALVTGAGRGIGRAIALRLAEEGAMVVINDADLAAAEATAAAIESLGRRALPIQADVIDRAQVKAMVDQAANRFGTIDILINNAGVGGSSCLVQEMPPQSWDQTVAVNLTGVFNCCRAIAPLMIARGRGGIVNVSSLAGVRMSKLGGADYTAAKWGVIGLSKHLAFELAAHGVRVNVVCPGATLTPLVESKTEAAFRAEVGQQVPLGRWITPEEQAEAVLFLVSPRGAMITGHVMVVDGGQLLGLASDYQEDLERRAEISARNLKAKSTGEQT